MIGSGFGEQADKSVFIVGPTGLALGKDGVLYVSDATANSIVAIPDAATRTDSAGTGKEVTKGGLLKRPLAMATAPNGHLLVTNALNGQVVEVDPVTGKQIYAHWIDTDKAQTPPGSGDLFGIAMTPDGAGFYYVQDDQNTVVLAEKARTTTHAERHGDAPRLSPGRGRRWAGRRRRPCAGGDRLPPGSRRPAASSSRSGASARAASRRRSRATATSPPST